jgi:hypothetical protein
VQIAPFIEGQHKNLSDFVCDLCQDVQSDLESVHNAVKNIMFTEATRKSYSHDKRALKYLICRIESLYSVALTIVCLYNGKYGNVIAALESCNG